jgi:HAD superfamily hydrolase (TIGR01509 family)
MTAAPPIHAVVLDMDGLMLDTEGMSRTAWQRTLAEWGLAVSENRYLELIGLTAPDVGKKMRIWYGSDIPFDSIYARKLALVNEIIAAHGIPHKRGLTAFLDLADSLSWRKAVATSTDCERARYKLNLSGLEGRFDSIVGGDEVQHGKPAPDIFLLAARRLGVPTENCLALEDSDPGALAAHAAGMRVIVIPDQKPPAPETAAIAWRVSPDLRNAAEFIVRQMQATLPP